MHIKSVSEFALALENTGLDTHNVISHMNRYFQESLILGRNIVISSEAFDGFTETSTARLKSMLDGFEVTIVYVYRELLSHLISLHFEENRYEHNIRFSSSFATFLFKTMDRLPNIVQPLPVLALYANAFGQKSIRIIDLKGCEADHQDVNKVLVCEIMNVSCENSAIFAPRTQHSNTGYNLISSQAFSYFNSYVEKQHQRNPTACSFCAGRHSAFRVFDAQYRDQLTAGTVRALPTLQSSLSMLVPYAERMDAELRAKYNKRILHSNKTANVAQMRESTRVEALDQEHFATDIYWERWMERMYVSALTQGLLCACA